MKRGVVLVFVAAAAFTVMLQSFVPGEVFVAGDTGVKALMMHQFARGDWAADLRLPAPPWARSLWDAGLYPLTPHHVETMGGRRYIQWSLAFPALTAPLYRIGGYRAALLVPLAATWIVWIVFARTLRSMRVSQWAIAAGLAGLAFTTYLTFYSATYWEHTISVALAFSGASLVLVPATPSRARTVGGCLLAGCCVWFREEMVLLIGLLGVATIWRVHRHPGAGRGFASGALALAALATAPLLYLAWNRALYGSVWGVHVMSVGQWLDEEPQAAGFGQALAVLWGFVKHAPMVLLAPLALRRTCRNGRPSGSVFLAVGLAFVVGLLLIAPFQGGREWGPRYLLAAVPFLAVAATVALEDIARWRSWIRVSGLTAATGLLTWGAWNETWHAARELRTSYARRFESLRGVQDAAPNVVAVSHPFVTQQLVATIPPTAFFLTPGFAELGRLGEGLFDHGIERFLYLCNPAYDCGPIRTGEVAVVRVPTGRPAIVDLQRRGPMGRYMAYDGSIRRFDFGQGGRVDVSRDDAAPLLARGWSTVRRRHETVPFRWVVSPQSCLLLPVSHPTTLSAIVRARGMRARLPQTLVVSLNGETLARTDLDSAWSDLRFVAHASRWVAGGNMLCLDFGAGYEDNDGAVGAVAFVELRR